MDTATLLEQIKQHTILGHIDADDEGIDGDLEGQPGVVELVDQALAAKVPGQGIINALSAGMEEVGRRFEAGDYLIPDMIASAECVGSAMDTLEPVLGEEAVAGKGRIVLATVRDDLHDIGKNIVAVMLKGAGFHVIDLGINVGEDDIVNAAREHNARYIGLSALLTSTMVNMEAVITRLNEAGLHERVKVIVGGAPVTAEFADKIGADAYAHDAFDAIEKLGALNPA
ncbi:MAG: corrinoid protein [Planctomycetota bacterium]